MPHEILDELKKADSVVDRFTEDWIVYLYECGRLDESSVDQKTWDMIRRKQELREKLKEFTGVSNEKSPDTVTDLINNTDLSCWGCPLGTRVESGGGIQTVCGCPRDNRS